MGVSPRPSRAYQGQPRSSRGISRGRGREVLNAERSITSDYGCTGNLEVPRYGDSGYREKCGVDSRRQRGQKRAVRELAQREYEEAKAEERHRIEQEVTSSRRAVYGIPTQGAITQVEKEQIREVYRNLWDVVQIQTQDLSEAKETLGQMLDQAARTGDDMLARVAYQRALDIGAQPSALGDFGMQAIVDRYLADKPQEAKALERYNNALQAANQAKNPESLLAQALTGRMFAS